MGEYRMFTAAEAIAFNPSSDTLASFDADFVLRTRNAHDGHVVREFALSPSDLPIQITYFSPDGRFLVAQKHRSNGIVFDVNSGEVVTRFNERSRWRLGLFRTIRGEGWIDVDRGLELDHEPFSSAPALFTVTGPPRVIRAPVVSHDGRWLAAGCDDRAIYVWDLEQDGPPTKLVGHESQIKSLAFSNDGGTLVSQNFDDTVRFWDIATGAEVLRLGTADERIHSMALSADSRLLALGVERDGRFGLRLHRLSTRSGSAVDGEAATVANPSR
jgi:WD40 repeat protein